MTGVTPAKVPRGAGAFLGALGHSPLLRGVVGGVVWSDMVFG